MQTPVIRHGAASVFFGEKSGKYPDGNQVVVRGADTLVAFDTPLVANRLGRELLDADLVMLGHVHEDHMAGLHRLPRARSPRARSAIVEAARSWEGLSRHYGYCAAGAGRDARHDQARFPLRAAARCAALPRRRCAGTSAAA